MHFAACLTGCALLSLALLGTAAPIDHVVVEARDHDFLVAPTAPGVNYDDSDDYSDSSSIGGDSSEDLTRRREAGQAIDWNWPRHC